MHKADNGIRVIKSSTPARTGGGFYRIRAFAVALVLMTCSLASCQTVPVTGRLAFNKFSQTDDMELGAQAYEQMLAEERVISSGADYEMVNRIMDRLIVAVGDDDPGYAWEVRFIDNDQVANAWALPGGKMAVYTGILPITQNETGLAVVMGHEMAHALARHGTQRMSTADIAGTAIELLGQSVDHAAGVAEAANMLVGVLQLGYGRTQELEADAIGLQYMAMAGYDPREAVEFWGRMAAMSGAEAESSLLSQWLSTHPSNDKRIAQIEALLPKVMPLYEAATGN